MRPSTVTVVAIQAWAAVAAPSGQLRDDATLLARHDRDPDNSHGQFIPTTNIVMTNVYQGYKDECLTGCRRHAVCLRFPWGYQTCFDTKESPITFSYDRLFNMRFSCNNDNDCPNDQRCLEHIRREGQEDNFIWGYCAQRSTYQMNLDAICKGRYQKVGKPALTDMRSDAGVKGHPIGKPDIVPIASFDQDFARVNGYELIGECKPK